jgi:hypothetical protein
MVFVLSSEVWFAFKDILLLTVVAKFGSEPRALANSANVSKVLGAWEIKLPIAVLIEPST